MAKKLIVPQGGPPAVGPYSPAVLANGFLFVSGQIPINPQTGEIVKETFEKQARQTLDNVRCVVEAGGCTLEDVVKITIFLTDLARFAELNTIYEEYFGQSKPARACVQAAALPKGVEVEIEAIAVLP